MGVQIGYFGTPEVVSSFNLIGYGNEGVILFGYTYGVEPFLELYCAVLQSYSQGGPEERYEFSGD